MPDIEHDIDLVHFLRTRTAHREIASKLECDIELVGSVYDWLPSPFYSNPQNRNRYLNEQKRLREIAALARALANKAKALDSSILENEFAKYEVNIEGLKKISERIEIRDDLIKEAPIFSTLLKNPPLDAATGT